MAELGRKDRIQIARRLREYAHFLRAYTSYTEMDEYEWDFPIFCTVSEIQSHVSDILDEWENSLEVNNG